ncbi:MAG: hypothetical protein NUV83_00225 [Candidatus Wolfebacteria bacterium]|nr:hypothetical protein [Candidatus Wolfebacteria bacterium]
MELQNQDSESGSNDSFNSSPDSSLSPVQKKSYRKFVLSFLAIIIALFVGYPILKTLYNDYFAQRGFDAYFSAEQDYLNALKNDKYGGKTPEETYFMYLDALKKGDILLASKYYIGIEGPGRAYKWLVRLQSEGWLGEYVNKLPIEWSNLKEVDFWDRDSKKFAYEYIQKKNHTFYDTAAEETSTIPAGKYQGSIIFQFSKPAQIWKLYQN